MDKIQNRRKTNKIILYSFLGIVLLFVLVVIIGSTQPSQPETKTAAAKTVPTKAVVTAQQKNDYITFYKQFMAIGDKSDKADNKISTDITNGNLTDASMYMEASDAHDTQESLKHDIASLRIPDSLSDYNNTLNNAETDLYTLIDTRTQAMSDIEDYLNKQDLAKLNDYKKQITKVKDEQMITITDLETVAVKLGVDVTKIN